MTYIIDVDNLVFFPPYLVNGHRKALLPYRFTNKPGVYFIKENGKLVYVGSATSSLYHTLYRHFQKWEDNRGYSRLTYKDLLNDHQYEISVQVVLKEHVLNVETAYIRKYQPRDNKYKIERIEFDEWLNDQILIFESEPEMEECPF